MYIKNPDTSFLIIFDFDGVLSDSKEAYANQMIETLESFKVSNITIEDIKARVGNTDQRSDFIEFLQTDNPCIVNEAMNKYVKLTEKYSFLRELFPGVLEVLEDLHKDNYLGIVSRKSQERMEYWLKHFKITHYFDVPIGTLENSKTAAIKRIMEKLKFPKERTLMIGDTEFDIISAKSADVYSVLALYDAAEPEKVLKTKPDYCINYLNEIFAIIEDIKQKNTSI